MKKITLLSILIVFILSSKAQVKFGLKGSYNIPTWTWSSGEEIDVTSSGITLGGIVDYSISEISSIRAELNYSNLAFKLSDKNSFESNFIELPFMLRVDIANGLHSYFRLGVGFKMSDEAYWSLTDKTLEKLPILGNYRSEYLQSTRVFFPYGIAYDFGMLFIDARYNINIKDMGNDDVDFVKGIGGFSFGIGCVFK